MNPKHLKYTDTHEWLAIDGKTARLGITHFAQTQLGDIVFVELPKVGTAIAARAKVAGVESVKTFSDVYSPVTGTIKAVNTQLEADPALVNQEPYEGGWMVEIELAKPEEANPLLDADAYEKHCAAHGQH